MIALYILGGFLLLLAGLLCLSPTVYVTIREEVSVKVGVLGLRFGLPQKKQKASAPKEQTPRKKKRKKPAEKQAPAKPTPQTFGETVERILAAVRAILPPAGRMLRHLRFVRMKVLVSVGCGDAADTATRFGLISAGIYDVLGMLSHSCVLRVRRVAVYPDFLRDETFYDISFCVKLRLWFAVWAGLCMLWRLLKNTVSDKKTAVNGSPKKKRAV